MRHVKGIWKTPWEKRGRRWSLCEWHVKAFLVTSTPPPPPPPHLPSFSEPFVLWSFSKEDWLTMTSVNASRLKWREGGGNKKIKKMKREKAKNFMLSAPVHMPPSCNANTTTLYKSYADIWVVCQVSRKQNKTGAGHANTNAIRRPINTATNCRHVPLL